MMRLTDDQKRALGDLLSVTYQACVKCGMPVFINASTLLGAVRDQTFINIEAFLITDRETFLDRIRSVRRVLARAGYRANLKSTGSKAKMIVNGRNMFPRIQIQAYTRKKDVYVRSRRRSQIRIIPRLFFENLTTIELEGQTYPCPVDPERYLEYLYRDWRTPTEPIKRGDSGKRHAAIRTDEFMGVDRGYSRWK